jgi:predicted phage tail protein
LLVKIKPHSAYAKYFSNTDLEADLTTYYDLFLYLKSMQPRFAYYLKEQELQGVEEGFTVLDKNLKEVRLDELMLRRAKTDDVIYIVPAIVGGGGKRGLLAAFAIFALFTFFPLGGLGAGIGGGAGAGAGAAAGTASSGFFGGIQSIWAAIPTQLQGIVLNVGLGMLASLFSKKPKEEQARQNDLFGSLTNSTTSGTPIAIHYGQVRVAGQMLSGYIKSVAHARSDTISVEDVLSS